MKVLILILLFYYAFSVDIVLYEQSNPPLMPFSYPFQFFYYPKVIKISKYKWIDVLNEHHKKCNKDTITVFLTTMISPNHYLHLISLITFFEKEDKQIFGIEFGKEMSGFMIKCENIPYITQYIQNLNIDLHFNILLNEFLYQGKRVYRYRYDLKTFEVNLGFNFDECRIKMISPCDLDDPFEFRPERTIQVDLALKDPFFDTILKNTKFSISTGQGSCQNICSSQGKKCLIEGYSIVNNCRIMKQFLKCQFCVNFDEGPDHPFFFDKRCRLMSRFGFNCHQPGPGGKICPCIE